MQIAGVSSCRSQLLDESCDVKRSRSQGSPASPSRPHHRQPASGQHHHGLAEARNRVEVSRLKAEYVSQEAQYLTRKIGSGFQSID